jgi:Uma2 family endonuclease
MVATLPALQITWERLPDDYILPQEPVDNILQPALAAALTESLALSDRLSETSLTSTNYGICATLNGQLTIKAPDWAYIPRIHVPQAQILRSYTPYLQGETPRLVIEFLSATEGDEYSIKPTYPPGKWFFYEQILRVPYYAIFNPQSGELELYHLEETGRYTIQRANERDRYWLGGLSLFLGVWQGEREGISSYWLRWWDKTGEILPWATEKVQAEQERTEQERQRAEQEKQRADRLAAQLRSLGIEPESPLTDGLT